MENSIFVIVIEEHRVVIKLILYDQYIFASFLGFFMVFIIKRLNYIEFKVFWKGKEKGELEVQEARIGYCPF